MLDHSGFQNADSQQEDLTGDLFSRNEPGQVRGRLEARLHRRPPDLAQRGNLAKTTEHFGKNVLDRVLSWSLTYLAHARIILQRGWEVREEYEALGQEHRSACDDWHSSR